MSSIEIHAKRKAGPYRLDTVPGEIIQAIALALEDVKSASSFTRVCKAFRDAGERRIWQTLDITSGWTEKDNLKSNQLSMEESSRRALGVNVRLRRARSSLDAYPFRWTCIRTLRVEPTDVTWGSENTPLAKSFIELIRRLSGQITGLEVLPLPRPSEEHLADHDHRYFFDQLRDAKLHFPHLRHLKLTFGDDVKNPIDTYILGMPNLQDLEIAATSGHIHEVPTYTLPQGSLPFLRRLTFDHIFDQTGDHSLTILTALLKAAPNIAFLRLRGKWSPKADHPALVAMAACEKLKTVVVVESGEHTFDEFEIDVMVKYWRLGAVDLAMESLVAEVPDWKEPYEPGFTRCRLPYAPHLQHVTFLTAPRPPLSDYVSMGIGPTPPITLPVTRYDLAGIRQNPHLCTILLHHIPKPFPSIYDANYVEPLLFVDPSRWEAEGYRGSVLRQYVNPLDSEDEFWHVRTLSRAAPREDEDEFGYAPLHPPGLLDQRVWQDYTLYKDATVPRDVLEAAYAAAGEKWDFIQGGRSLTLGEGDAAWSILRQWREGVYVEYEGKWDDGLDEDSEAEHSQNSEDDAAFENWMANGPDPGDGAWLGYGPMGHFPDDGSSP